MALTNKQKLLIFLNFLLESVSLICRAMRKQKKPMRHFCRLPVKAALGKHEVWSSGSMVEHPSNQTLLGCEASESLKNQLLLQGKQHYLLSMIQFNLSNNTGILENLSLPLLVFQLLNIKKILRRGNLKERIVGVVVHAFSLGTRKADMSRFL